MEKIAKFEKVTLNQFEKDYLNAFPELTIKNNLGGLSVNYHFDENSNKEFIDINGNPLIVDGKLFTE